MKLAKRKNTLTIKKLEKLMISHGIVLRAIPERVINIFEKGNIDRYPTGVIKYVEDYKREMLVVESVPQNAGKFILEFQPNTSSIVKFFGNKYYDTIEQALKELLKLKKNYT